MYQSLMHSPSGRPYSPVELDECCTGCLQQNEGSREGFMCLHIVLIKYLVLEEMSFFLFFFFTHVWVVHRKHKASQLMSFLTRPGKDT